MTTAQPLHLKLFLEGEDIPVVSAQIGININAPSTASIQIIPIDEGVDFKPRTMVHLFIYDGYSSEKSTYVDTGTYRLLFLGEIIGVSSVRSPGSRGIVLQCVDFTNYWMCAHATAISYGGEDSNAFVDHAEDTAGNNLLFDDLPGGEITERLVQWTKEAPRTPGLEGIAGLAGGIIRVMEAVGGVMDSDGKRLSGFNDFFTVAELRSRLLQQVCAEEKDDSAKRLLENEEFTRFITNSLQNIGRQVTLNDIILLLMQHIYYDFVPNPAPKYEPSVAYKSVSTGQQMTLSNSREGKTAYEYLVESLRRVQTVHKMLTDAGVEDTSSIDQFDPYVEYPDVPYSLSPNQKLPSPPKYTTPKTALQIAERKAKTVAAIREALSEVTPLAEKSKKLISAQRSEHPNMLPQLDDIIHGIEVIINYSKRSTRSDLTVQDLDREITSIKEVMRKMEDTYLTSTVTTYSGGSSQRLKSVIFRPNCWYAAPPRCNVIFPEQYFSVNYDRNFIGEVTRLRVGSASELQGRDNTDLINDARYSPPLDFLAPDEITDLPRSYRFLMSHELHTGIVPRTMWLPEKLDAANGTNDWLQKSADYHYFSARFASRTLSISGRFNPGLVCGFPGAVILRPMTLKSNERSKAKNIDSLMTAEDIPYQFIGMIGSISHNVDQNGGSTSITMTHARRHRGLDDELLSLKYNTTTSSDRIVSYVLTKKDVANEAMLPFSGDAGPAVSDIRGVKRKLLTGSTPQGPAPVTTVKVGQSKKTKTVTKKENKVDPVTKQVVEVTTTTDVEVNSESSSKKRGDYSFTRIDEIPGVPGIGKVRVPDGNIEIVMGQTDGLFGGKIVGVEVVNAKRSQQAYYYVFDAIRIYEKISVAVAHTPPLEEIVHPDWMSDGFLNENLTDRIYGPFLGCKSVVDEVSVSGATKGSKAEFNGSTKGAIPVDSKSDVSQVKSKVEKNEESRSKNSVDRAITWWSFIYGGVKSTASRAKDVEKFIRDFTYRPIATIDQVLGTRNLTYVFKGTLAVPLTGKEGFHTPATHPDIITASEVLRLVGLLDNPDAPYPRMSEAASAATIPKRYDVRYEKRQAVLAYKKSLILQGRGLRG